MEFELEDDELAAFDGEGELSIDDSEDNELISKEPVTTTAPTKKKYKRKIRESISSDEENVDTTKKKRRVISKELEQQLGRAQKLYLAEQFGEAIQLLLEVITQKPNLSVPYVTLSMIHEELDDPQQALSYLLLAAQVSENDADLWATVASKSRENGNPQQALYCYRKAILYSANNDFVWDKAMLLEEIGDYRGAIISLNTLLDENPADGKVTEEIANIYIHTYKDTGKGLEVLKNCIEKQLEMEKEDKIDMNIVNLLLELYIKNSNYKEGSSLVQKVTSVVSEIPIEIHINHGICLAHLNQISRAERLFSSLSGFSKEEYGDLYQIVGEVYLELKKYDKAEKYLLAVVGSTLVDIPQLFYGLSVCSEAKGDYAEALDYLQRVMEINPFHRQACIKFSQLFLNKKDKIGALAPIEKYLEECDANQWEILQQKAAVHFEFEEYDEFFKTIEIFTTKEFAEKVRIRKYRKNNNSRLEKEIEQGGPYSEEVKDYIAQKVLEEDGDELLLNFGAPPKAKKPYKPDDTVNQKKDAFLEKFVEQMIEFISKMLKREHYAESQKLLELLEYIEKRPCIYKSIRKYKLKYLKSLSSLAIGDFETAYLQLRDVIWKASSITEFWKLLSFIIAKCDTMNILRTSRFIQAIRKVDDKNAVQAIILYGHLQIQCGQTRRAVKPYYYAYLQEQDNPFTCLYVGISCIGISMNKNNENRHRIVLLGFSFMLKYLELSKHNAEANYNVGRAFHQLGLTHHAIQYYYNVLNDVKIYSKSSRDYKKPAAYNLSLIFKASGANDLARQLVHQYLTY